MQIRRCLPDMEGTNKLCCWLYFAVCVGSGVFDASVLLETKSQDVSVFAVLFEFSQKWKIWSNCNRTPYWTGRETLFKTPKFSTRLEEKRAVPQPNASNNIISEYCWGISELLWKLTCSLWWPLDGRTSLWRGNTMVLIIVTAQRGTVLNHLFLLYLPLKRFF